ncbi:MAG: FliH/SctL family protein [Candidatus Gastranaerophilales bacterium]|nr:FliH/SctL family protein [Candidatus Gastranaerophilales bacterium]
MTRIKSDNIQLAGDFVVPIEQSSHSKKLQEALEKEKEIILNGEKKAQEIVEQAQQQAKQIIEQAREKALSEVDAIQQQAHGEGFEAGRQEGLENITQELQDKIIAVDNFAKSQFDIKNNIIKSAHVDIINLIVEIAQKVCLKSLELDDKILSEITQNAIHSLKDKEDITIIVNSEMAEKIYAISEELKEKIPQLSSIKIVEDNSVSPDGTIVESPMSRVDCRVKSQINEIADKLMAKLDSTPIEKTGNREQETEDV